ncbi:MAG TPA: tetratricopeptide repeat protein [Burkholderiaceae bacterium]|nr:tetratricopeptide repeat protein [Burkholderiaceae bacterium]
MAFGTAVVLVSLAAMATLAGCHAIPGMRPDSNDAVSAQRTSANPSPGKSASTSSSANSSTQAASASAAIASGPPQVAVDVVVRPEAQRDFDAALAALRANRTADAERGLRALVRSDPGLAGPHANLGIIARRAGRLPEAVAELERAVALDPRQPAAWNELGIADREQGEFSKAREAYDHALAIDASYAPAVLNLGILHDLYLGESDAALPLYNRYLALTPAGDAPVTKWVADLNNRKSAAARAASAPASAATDRGASKEKS